MIGDDWRVNVNHASFSTQRDDNVQHVTRAMSRTDGVFEQISTIEDVLEFDCRQCELILEMQVYIADNDNRGHVDSQTLDKVGKVIEEDRRGLLLSRSVHDGKHEVHRRALYLTAICFMDLND